MKKLLAAMLWAGLASSFGHAGRADVVLLDNLDDGVVFTGTWLPSTWSTDRIGENYAYSNRVPDLTAAYTPDLPRAGTWGVEAFWNASSERGNDVPYTIHYQGGAATVLRDQRIDGNQWNNLGQYFFEAGTGGSVVISSTVSNGEYVVADAIRFTRIDLLTWDGRDDGLWAEIDDATGFSNWLDAGFPTAEFPGPNHRVVIPSGMVTVAVPQEALELQVTGGGLTIAGAVDPPDAAELSVVGSVQFAPGTTLAIGQGGALRAAGGSIDSLTAEGQATIEHGGDLEVGRLTLAAVNAALVKQGTGTLTVSHDGLTASPTTTLRIEQGTLVTGGAEPLGDVGHLELAGGTLQLDGPAGGTTVELGGTDLRVTGDSTFQMEHIAGASFHSLTLESGTLTVAGAADLSFSGPISGSGGLQWLAGNLTLGQPLEIDTLKLSSGTLTAPGMTAADVLIGPDAALSTSADVHVATFTTAGSDSIDLNGNALVISQNLRMGTTTMTVAGGTLRVSGPDLTELTFSGGELGFYGLAAPADPVAHFSFDHGADPGRDETQNGHDATLFGGPIHASGGKMGGALEFDGLDDYLTADSLPAAVLGTDLTVSAWVKASGRKQFAVAFNSGPNNGNRFLAGMEGSDGRFKLHSDDTYHDSTVFIADGQWHQVGWTLDTAVDRIGLFVDGRIVSTYDSPSEVGLADRFSIGQEWDAGVPSDFWEGLIDEVFLYDRVLGSGEIAALHDAGVAGDYGDGETHLHGHHLTVTADTTLRAGVAEIVLGDLTVRNPPGNVSRTTLTLADAAYEFDRVAADDGVSLVGGLTVRGSLSPGGEAAVGTLHVAGELELGNDAVFVCQIDDLANDKLICAEGTELLLGGQLRIETLGVALDEKGRPLHPGLHTYTIVDATAPGAAIYSRFAEPVLITDPEDPDYDRQRHLGHLGFGVFDRGVGPENPGGLTYHAIDPQDQSAGYSQVTADLFIARGADYNGDGAVDGLDVITLIEHYEGNCFRPTTGHDWTEGDTIGGRTGRGDGIVDGRDLIDLFANFGRTDPGTATAGTAVARYDPATGEVTVSVDDVMIWGLFGEGEFTGSDLGGFGEALPPRPLALISANENGVSEGTFDGLLSYRDVNLGKLVEPGTDPAELSLEFVVGFGHPRLQGTITVVPEPASGVMLVGGLLGLWWLRRRRGG